MTRLGAVVFDCVHPARVARFWAEVLDGYAIAPYDDEELARLRSIGIDDPEDDPSVLVESGDGALRLWFQKVPEGKVAKNRVHLDVFTHDLAGEVARLLDLGARVIRDEQDGLVVMADVENNEFCVIDE